MLTPQFSPNYNPNYTALMFLLQEHHIHSVEGSDNLVKIQGNFESILANKHTLKVNEWYVYIPTGSKVAHELLHGLSLYRDKDLNKDPNTSGYFESNRRVKTIKLRGQYSSGFMFPVSELESVVGDTIERKETSFDMIGDLHLCRKYIVYTNTPSDKEPTSPSGKKAKQLAKVNLLDGQFKFHEDTENLRRNIYKLKPFSEIEISYKGHGSSFIVSNLLFQPQLKWYEKVIKFFNKKYQAKPYYDYVWSSRRVIKNNEETKGFYSQDIWTIIKEEIKDKIPKGYTLYGEVVGQLPNGQWIQKDYDYGTEPNTHKLFIYRITVTNEDGLSTELTYKQIQSFCKSVGLSTFDLFYTGTVYDYVKEHSLLTDEQKQFLSTFDPHTDNDRDLNEFYALVLDVMERQYNEKDCYMCKNVVPEEGIIVRFPSKLYAFEAYKLKSFRFLEREGKELDAGVVDIEETGES